MWIKKAENVHKILEIDMELCHGQCLSTMTKFVSKLKMAVEKKSEEKTKKFKNLWNWAWDTVSGTLTLTSHMIL